MTNFHQKDSNVSWKWGSGKAQGKIEGTYHDSISKTIKGAKITRNGTKDNPAYFIKQKNGNHVLKLHSELTSHKELKHGGHSTEDDKHFIPTTEIAKLAKKGLELHDKFGKGGTDVGVKRAKQLIDREYLAIKDIKSMYSYFKRHTIDKKAKDFGSDKNPSKGYIAWLLWGGDTAEAWVNKIHEKFE